MMVDDNGYGNLTPDKARRSSALSTGAEGKYDPLKCPEHVGDKLGFSRGGAADLVAPSRRSYVLPGLEVVRVGRIQAG